MAVIINIVGIKNNSDEYLAAEYLKSVLERDLEKNVMGEIYIHPSVTLFGQAVKDVDIVVTGSLMNCIYTLNIQNEDGVFSNKKVEIRDFCTVIEVKSHGIRGIVREGTDFYVKYPESLHNVTLQSNKQKEACKSFILSMQNGISPYVTNMIWFTGISKEEFVSLSTVNGKKIRNNVLTNDLIAYDFFQLLAWQFSLNPTKNGMYYLSSHLNNGLEKIFAYFDIAKAEMGELTRKRIEQMSKKAIGNLLLTESDELVLYRGKAGTGKTVGIVQTAIKLVDEKEARVLILTYNRALVSDMRRLFAFAELPDLFQESCVSINTIHAFFYRIIKNGLYDGVLDSSLFLANYQTYMNELISFLESDCDAKEVLIENMSKDAQLNWDYCLIDEGQDWTPYEQRALLNLFSQKQVIVADGGMQFVRKKDICDWTLIDNRKSVKLKYCLRQKNNIITFINHYLSVLDMPSQKIMSNNKLPGGKIVISKYDNNTFSIIAEELKSMKKIGNVPYDMLVFTPGKYVDKDSESFIDKNKFEVNNIPIWDGTSSFNRMEYALSSDEIRVLHYKSGRGLEAWTVVCIELDTYIESIIRSYKADEKVDSLALESEHDKRMKYLVNWLMIPLTRAIDTLIITLRDYDSTISKQILKIANEHPDYITIK